MSLLPCSPEVWALYLHQEARHVAMPAALPPRISHELHIVGLPLNVLVTWLSAAQLFFILENHTWLLPSIDDGTICTRCCRTCSVRAFIRPSSNGLYAITWHMAVLSLMAMPAVLVEVAPAT